MCKTIELMDEIKRRINVSKITMNYFFETDEHHIKLVTELGTFSLTINDRDLRRKSIDMLIIQIVDDISTIIAQELFL